MNHTLKAALSATAKRRNNSSSNQTSRVKEPENKKKAVVPSALPPLETAPPTTAGEFKMSNKHPHPLLHFSEYVSSCCDICRHQALVSNSTGWHCAECEFDVCEACMRSNPGLVSPPITPTNASSNSTRMMSRISDEFFSPVYLNSKLHQSQGLYSTATMDILSENEIDMFLIRKLQDEGLQELGIHDALERQRLLAMAQEEFSLSSSSNSSSKNSKRLPNELFSYVWFVSKLVQSQLVKRHTVDVLGSNEVDLCLLKKLGPEGLEDLGISEDEERRTVLEFASYLESILS